MDLEAVKSQEAVQPLKTTVGDGSVTLRGKPSDKAKTGTWRAASIIYVVIFVNSLVLVAIQGNLITYTVNVLHLDLATGANLVNYFSGAAMLAPIVFGFLADAYFGPFWIIIISCVLYAAGLINLVLSVSLPNLVPPECDQTVCEPASEHIQTVFRSGVFITAMGAAGIKPTVLSLGKQQFDVTDPVEKKKGNLFFALYYAVYDSGLFLATTVLFWIQTEKGFSEGYSIMTGLFYAGIIIFLLGIPYLRHQKPTGSPLTILAMVIVAAIRNWRKPLPADPAELYEIKEETLNPQIDRIRQIVHTDRLRFLDKAAIIPNDSEFKQQQINNWKLCTVTQVEVLKGVVLLFPNWLCATFSYVVAAQQVTFGVQQVAGMNRSLGPNFDIPPATVSSMSLIASLIYIVLYEYVLVPVLKKWTDHPRGLSPLIRIGIALFMAFLIMVIAALVEMRRVDTIRDNNLTAVQVKQGLIPMSFLWLLPQLALTGICHPLLGTAQLELFHQELPETMASLSMALTFGCQALGKFLTVGIVDLTGSSPGKNWLKSEFNSGGLTKFYWLISVIAAVNFVVYIISAHFYSYKKLKSGVETESEFETSSIQDSGSEMRPVFGDDSNLQNGNKQLVLKSD